MNWFVRHRMHHELSEEIRQHLEEKLDALVASGICPDEAEYRARREFGNVTLLEEKARLNWGWTCLDCSMEDLRYACRQVLRAPGFSLTVILTLALGIGANLAIFQLLYAVMFAQLPVSHPDQLYSLHAVKSPFDGQWFFSCPAYERLRQATANSAPVLARSGLGRGILQTQNGLSQSAKIQLVSANFFNILGVSPRSGRVFVASDDGVGQSQWPAVLRYGYWKQDLGSDASIVGKQVVLNSVPVVIAGIAPEGFSGVMAGDAPDLWLPLAAQSSGRFNAWFDSLGPGYGVHLGAPYRNQAGIFWLWVIARIAEPSKAAAVASWTHALQPDLALMANASKDPHTQEQIRRSQVGLISAATGEGTLKEEYGQALLLLMGLSGMVLLVGCLNLANLQLARSLSRQRELAVRIALGASGWRILRQLLFEDLLLAMIGSGLAFLIGRVASSLLLHWGSAREQTIPMDLHLRFAAVAFGVVLVVAALLCFSLIPAWSATRGSFQVAANSRTGTSSQSRAHAFPWSNLLLTGQVSFSLLLLGMAALFGRTILNLNHVNAGLDRDHILSIHFDFQNATRREDPAGLYDRMLSRLRQLPNVQDAAVQMCRIPECMWHTAIHVAGHPEIPEERLHGEENHVGAGYFHTMGIPVLRGRDLAERDIASTQSVAVLNSSFAKRLFGDQNPIGHRVGYQGPPADATYVVVGEVGDARVDDLRSSPPPIAYFPVKREDQPEWIEVRARGKLDALSRDIRQTLLSVDASLPITEIVALNTQYEDGLSKETLLARLTTAFGVLTLALAALGFYGLLSFSVTRRTAEIGVRMALGASQGNVYALIFRHTCAILLAGILPGIALLRAGTLAAKSLLYGTATTELWTVAEAVFVLIAVGILSAYVPARRAASIEPVQALRRE